MADADKPVTGDNPPKPTGPTADDIEKMQAALHKANEEAKKYRLDAKAKDDELAALKKDQDSSKSDMQKVQEQIAALTSRAEKAERDALVAQVAHAKKLPAFIASRMTGTTVDELEAEADEAIEALGLRTDDNPPVKQPPSQKAKEKLRGGSNPEAEPEIDPLKLAAQIGPL
jgi:chromosome segregation ATPase